MKKPHYNNNLKDTSENNKQISTDEKQDLLMLADEDEEISPSTSVLTVNTWKMMIVDDEVAVHQTIQLVLKGFVFRGKYLTLFSAYSAEQAKLLLNAHPDIAIILLDVVMEDTYSGLQLVKYIRDTLQNQLVRIILHTGQPGEAPEEAVVVNYDINDYVLKSEMTHSKMFTITTAGLRAYRDLVTLKTNQVTLKQINVQLQQEIVERQQAEHELQQHRVHLEELVAKRTDELAKVNVQLQQDIVRRKQIEEELITSKEFAESANRAKSTFLACMSHELRTPLNGILGYTQILNLDKSLTSKQREGIHIIHRNGTHLLTLINDILDFSKIEANKLELISTNFRLDGFLKNIVDFFNMQAAQKDIEFVYEPLPQLPIAIYTDEKRLRQILLNLLSNAVKFTHTGQITFQVKYQPKDSGEYQGTIHFDVEDSGEGIKAEHLETIFLPFQQINHQNRQNEGTGLGLSITKQLVDMMDGKLHVNSTFGIGSHFWFEIPIQESQIILEEIIRTPNQTIVGFQRKGNSNQKEEFKILVVDDKWENRIVLASLLTPLGFTLLEAKDGQEALTKAYEFHPDVIIMDLKMPVMDGLECTRLLRKDARFQETIIIALSASVFDDQQRESLDAGCNAFLDKPIDTDKFLQTLPQHCPLQWIYEISPKKNVQTTMLPSANIIPPTVEQAKELYHLARIGDIEGVRNLATVLLKNESHLQPFIQEVCQLTEAFQLKKLKCFLEQYLQ